MSLARKKVQFTGKLLNYNQLIILKVRSNYVWPQSVRFR